MRHTVGSILITLLALAIGVVLGMFIERWHANALGRSDVVCVASRQELSRLKEMAARFPNRTSDRDHMGRIEQTQANIARNCGWLPPAATLPPPKPTEAPKPAASPKSP